MHNNYHNQLQNLRKNFLDLGLMVEDRVRTACQALMGKKSDGLDIVIRSDYEIDAMEIEIEEECLKILALHQPVAKDLRFLIALIKINSELERIGDYAVQIARRVKFILEHESPIPAVDYDAMADKVLIMLRMSLDALVQKDSALAHEIFHLDDAIDVLRNRAYDLIKEELRQAPEHAGCLLNGYLVARHLERIADRATNIAEEVIYMVGGDIIRGELN